MASTSRGDHIFNDSQKVFARYTHKNIDNTGTNGSGDYNTLAGTYSRPINVRNLAASTTGSSRPR